MSCSRRAPTLLAQGPDVGIQSLQVAGLSTTESDAVFPVEIFYDHGGGPGHYRIPLRAASGLRALTAYLIEETIEDNLGQLGALDLPMGNGSIKNQYLLGTCVPLASDFLHL